MFVRGTDDPVSESSSTSSAYLGEVDMPVAAEDTLQDPNGSWTHHVEDIWFPWDITGTCTGKARGSNGREITY